MVTLTVDLGPPKYFNQYRLRGCMNRVTEFLSAKENWTYIAAGMVIIASTLYFIFDVNFDQCDDD